MHKNLNTIIKAFNSKNIKKKYNLVIAGYGQKNIKISNNIFILGKISEEKKLVCLKIVFATYIPLFMRVLECPWLRLCY